MPRTIVVLLALAGLAALVTGVVGALPLVFWGTSEERAAIEHGRTVMLIGAVLMLAAAAGARPARVRIVLAAAALLPTALALAAPGTAFGLLALPVAIGACVGAIAQFARATPAA
jgi:hypothetical protein